MSALVLNERLSSRVKTCYSVFTVQPESLIRNALVNGESFALHTPKAGSVLTQEILTNLSNLQGRRVQGTPMFGWVGLGNYPTQKYDIFSNFFFADTHTNFNILQLANTIEKYYLIELSMEVPDVAVYYPENFRSGRSILGCPDQIELMETVYGEQPAVFMSIRAGNIIDVLDLKFEGNLRSFTDNGINYICRGLNPPKGMSLTPEIIENEMYYQEDTLSIWTITPIRGTGIFNRPYTWAAGVSFGSKLIVEG